MKALAKLKCVRKILKINNGINTSQTEIRGVKFLTGEN